MKKRIRMRRFLVGFASAMCAALVGMWIDRHHFPIIRALGSLVNEYHRTLKTIGTLLLLMLTPVALTAYFFWRINHKPKGKCAECGYNLTGNVSGVCPECGTDIEAA